MDRQRVIVRAAAGPVGDPFQRRPASFSSRSLAVGMHLAVAPAIAPREDDAGDADVPEVH